ncbi:MAG: primosomal protein N', partial [Eubacteriales bacterium]
MEQIAKIAVASAIYAIDKAYSYRIPSDASVEIGMRVVVPFGRGNRRSEGVILSLEPLEDGVFKTIEQILDPKPILSPAMLRLAAWIRGRYFCTMYDAIRGMLPAGFWFTNKEYYRIPTTVADWKTAIKRKTEAAKVMELIENLGGIAEGADLRKAFPDESFLEQNLQYLVKKKLLICDEAVSAKLSDKTEMMASLAVTAEEAMEYASRKKSTAPLQFEVLQLLSATGCGNSKEICYFTGASMTTLKRLQTLGFLELSKEPVKPMLLEPTVEKAADLVLNSEQTAVFDGLNTQMKLGKAGVALLYGVTGSGKTAVYIRLIEQVLEQGKSAMVLVPEIGLTPQLLRIFQSYFGSKVALLHSGLTMRGRVDQWKNIEAGEAMVVVGTRSAVFAPLQNLGLIVVDEEQEHTFLSENKPRYDARQVAMYRGVKENALVVLGSATPSIETMYRAKDGTYTLYRLEQRFNGKAMPKVEIVDMKEELKAANGTAISRFLAQSLQETWDSQHQAILFLNRRGASRCLVCVDCGTVPTCPNCTVNLTYHSANNRLICHHCGFSVMKPDRCLGCGGPLREVGTGTQKAQEELACLFSDTPILRMDGDTISAANSHEKILERFEKDQIPVMIGTQMV